MELNMRISAYLPATVRRYLEKTETLTVPSTDTTTAVCMFADVSGFTAMTENLAIRGPSGAESLGKHLNSYLEQILKLISSEGGDVFKFAGDALIVFWCENKEDTLETLARRCIQCALRIQKHLNRADLAPGVVLSIKIGVGVGLASVAHLGGESDGATSRIEYIGVGPALIQAFNAEHHARPGEVICSDICWQLISDSFSGYPLKDSNDDYHIVDSVTQLLRSQSRRASFTRDDVQLQERMQRYVSRAVWPYLDAAEEFWGSELRDVTVLFINTGFGEDDLSSMLDTASVHRLHTAFAAVQRCIFDYEGTINKFLVDDKGSTAIAVFGMPPVCHENDAVRGILASLAICAAMEGLGLKASIGITTGTAFCGVVGHQGNRREYTVLGDIVNLAARLMQRAKTERGGVLTDERTRLITKDVLIFEDLISVPVKGKLERIKINRPYVRQSVIAEYHMKKRMSDGQRTTIKNLHGIIHHIQVQRASDHFSLQHLEPTIVVPENSVAQGIQEALRAKVAAMNDLSPAGALLLEGDIGLGKTHLVCSTLRDVHHVVYAAATPFRTQDYGIFATVLKECCGETSIEEWVLRGVAPQNHWLNHLHVLNDLLDTDFEKPSNQDGNDTASFETASLIMAQMVADLSENQDEGVALNDSKVVDPEEYVERESLWSPSELDVAGILLLSALHAISRVEPLVIVLDNAMYMDEKSWIVAISMAKYFTNCLVVVVSRPPSGAITQRTASSAFRKQLRALKDLSSTTHCIMPRMLPEQIETLAAQILKVDGIPTELAKMLYSRSQGNPLFLDELVKEMTDQKVLWVVGKGCETRVQEAWGDKASAKYCFDCPATLDSTNARKRCKACGYVFCPSCAPEQCYKKLAGPVRSDTPMRHCKTCYGMTPGRLHSFERTASESKVALGPSAAREKKGAHRKVRSFFLHPTEPAVDPAPKHRTALAPPRLIKSVLTTLLDQLTHSQYMLMRTASVVGATFEIKVVKEIYPIKSHLTRFEEDLGELTRLSMIRPVDIFIGGLKEHVPKKYEFSHGFMHDVIISQMLSAQCDKIESRLTDHREQKDKEMRQLFYEKTHGILPHHLTPRSSSSSSSSEQSTVHPSRSLGKGVVIPLKTGMVFVKKHSSLLSHFRLKGSTMWKRRWAILHNSRIILQHDSNHGGRTTSIDLSGSRVSTCDMTHDPAAFKYHCLLLEVQEWSRWTQKPEVLGSRDFVLGVETDRDMKDWIYMIKYAIETLST